MAVKTSYPAIRPSLSIDFANARVIDSRVTFTRASTATYFDRFGVLQTAPSGVSRLNHDPATGESKGLLIEEQRTNLLTYSEQFDNAAWGKISSTVTANSVLSPNGTQTADTLSKTATAYSNVNESGIAVTAGTVYTLSSYYKAGTLTGASLSFISGTSDVRYWFDLSAGVVGGPIISPVGYIGSGIQSVGNGWYRCWISVTAQAATTSVYLTGGKADNAVAGDVSIWGAQLEAGAFPTSYIPTTSAQVTRAAEVPSMSGENFTNWFNAREGTIVVECDTAKLNLSSMLGLSAGSSYGAGNGFLLRVTAANNVEAGGHGATVSTGTLAAPVSANVPFKSAAFYKGTSQGVCAKGSTVKSNTSCDFTGVGTTSLILGALTTGGLQGIGSGHIKRIAFYPKLLSDAEYQGLTL